MTPQQFKKARISLGFTQKQMGEFLGRSTRMIKYYEAGANIPVWVKKLIGANK